MHIPPSMLHFWLFVFNKEKGLLLVQRNIIPWSKKLPLEKLKIFLKSRQIPALFWVIPVLPLHQDAQWLPPYIRTAHRTTLRETAPVYGLLATLLSLLKLLYMYRRERDFPKGHNKPSELFFLKAHKRPLNLLMWNTTELFYKITLHCVR